MCIGVEGRCLHFDARLFVAKTCKAKVLLAILLSSAFGPLPKIYPMFTVSCGASPSLREASILYRTPSILVWDGSKYQHAHNPPSSVPASTKVTLWLHWFSRCTVRCNRHCHHHCLSGLTCHRSWPLASTWLLLVHPPHTTLMLKAAITLPLA
jgi:hypothetical protein